MFLRYCPLCNLTFGCANELVWHIHNEHHRLTDDEQLKVELAQAASTELDWPTFAGLESAVSDAAISLLLGTTPGARRAGIDSAWLEHLSRSAYRRMAQELHPAVLAKIVPRLAATLSALECGPRGKGLAVLVSTTKIATFWLPLAPRARAALGTRFAVRDLLDALQRFPHYRALVLGGHGPRILEGWADSLDEVDCAVERRHHDPVSEADAVMAERVSASTELPLIVIGPPRLVGAWRERSHHSSLLIGTVGAHHLDAPKSVIATLAEPLVSTWREAVTTVETASLGHAERAGLIQWGLEATWAALAEGQTEHVWVRRDFAAPAVRDGNAWHLQPGPCVGFRRHTDDIVEELIRLATDVGATVTFVDKLAFASDEPLGVQVANVGSEPSARVRTRTPVLSLIPHALAI